LVDDDDFHAFDCINIVYDSEKEVGEGLEEDSVLGQSLAIGLSVGIF
jgi:hypothetical protein